MTIEEIKRLLEEHYAPSTSICNEPDLGENTLLGNAGTIIRQLLVEREEMEKLKATIRQYLNEPSTDGRVIRQSMRKQLLEMIDRKAEEG